MELQVMLMHGGSALAGHYYVYVRRDDTWFSCNDDRVDPVTDDNVESDENKVQLVIYTNKPNVRKLKGFPNTGNTCWLNSALQILMCLAYWEYDCK